VTIKSRKFNKGIRLKATDDAATLDGEIRNDKTNKRTKVYHDTDGVDAAGEKELVTTDNTQTMSNKTIDATDATGTGSISTDASDATFDDTVGLPPALGATTVQTALDAVKVLIEGQNEADEITYNPAGNPETTATEVQTALDDTGTASQAAQDTADDHISDTSGAHLSSAISYDPTNNPQTSNTVLQTALDETGTALETHINDATGAHAATAVSYSNATSGLTATETQAAIDEVEGRVDSAETATSDHLADTVDAHDASAISFDNVASGLTATETQAAIDEVEGRLDTTETVATSTASDLTNHTNGTSLKHDADAIINVPSGELTATDVQAALNELQTHIDTNETPTTTEGDVVFRGETVDERLAIGTEDQVLTAKPGAGEFTTSAGPTYGTTDGTFTLLGVGLTATNNGSGTYTDISVTTAGGGNYTGGFITGASGFSLGETVVIDTIGGTPADTSKATFTFSAGALIPLWNDTAAGSVTYDPSGSNLVATNTQSAIDELDFDTSTNTTNLSNHTGAPTGAHTASAITNVPSGNLTSTDVQSALNELQTELDSAGGGGVSATTVTDQTEATAYSPTEGDVLLVVSPGTALTFTQAITGVTIISDDNQLHVFSGILTKCSVKVRAAITYDSIDSNITALTSLYFKSVTNSSIRANNLYMRNFIGGSTTLFRSDLKSTTLVLDTATTVDITNSEISVGTLDIQPAISSTITFSGSNVTISNTLLQSSTLDIIFNCTSTIHTFAGTGPGNFSFNGYSEISNWTNTGTTLLLVDDNAHVKIAKASVDITGTGIKAGDKDVVLHNNRETKSVYDKEVINYLVGDDSNFETSVGNWVSTDPTNVPISIAGAVLRGGASMTMLKGAADYSGEYISVPFTIDPADLAKKLIISFDHDFSDKIVYNTLAMDIIQDPSGTPITITPNGSELPAGKGTHYAQFQTDATELDYELRIRLTDANNKLYTAVFDNIVITPQVITHGTIVTDWEDYTPIFYPDTGTITNHVMTGKYRRVGDSLEIQARLAFSGAQGTWNTLNLSMPSGLSIDASKVVSTTSGEGDLGSGKVSGVDATDTDVNYLIPTAVRPRRKFISGAVILAADFTSVTLTSGSALDLQYTVPIQGWSSNAKMSETFSGRSVFFTSYLGGAANHTTLGGFEKVLIDTVVTDTTASWDATNKYFVIPESGTYAVNASIGFASIGINSIGVAGISINGVDTTAIGTTVVGGNTGGVRSNLTETFSLNKGDTIALNGFQDESTSEAYTANRSSSYLTITKIASPQTILENETVAARYINSVGQTIGDGAYEVVDFGELTKGFDTHNAVTTGVAWKFTAPITGLYRVSSKVAFNNGSFAAGVVVATSLFKNGAAYNRECVVFSETTGSREYQLVGSDMVQLNKGEYIDIRVFQNTGTDRFLYSTGNLHNSISIERIK